MMQFGSRFYNTLGIWAFSMKMARRTMARTHQHVSKAVCDAMCKIFYNQIEWHLQSPIYKYFLVCAVSHSLAIKFPNGLIIWCAKEINGSRLQTVKPRIHNINASRVTRNNYISKFALFPTS